MMKNNNPPTFLPPRTLWTLIAGPITGMLAGAVLTPFMATGISTMEGMLAGFICGLFTAFIFVFIFNKTRANEQSYRQSASSQTEPLGISASHADVAKAVRLFSDQLPQGVYRTILIKDDYSIDFNPLIPYLGGVPDQSFYMSKETYEIFGESEKHLAPLIDQVQRAVDQYVQDHGKYPILDFDPLRRVNYFELKKGSYLKDHPDVDFYVTKYDGLLTHVKPEVKLASTTPPKSQI